MECTVYNPQKGRLETLNVEITEENTTWFRYNRNISSVTMITDWNGGLLIKSGFDYPIWVYDVTRAEIGYSQKKAKELVSSTVHA
jgi:predicted cation transporter